MRHPESGAVSRAQNVVDIPVINAGDGANQHPTQTLLDLFTIRETQGKLKQLKVLLAGDLKYSRTVHSLVQALSLYPEIEFYFVSPAGLEMPKILCDELNEKGICFSEHSNLGDIISEMDVIYMTRIQKERIESEAEAQRKPLILDSKMLKNIKQTACVLHPLPRQEELDVSVDDLPQAKYFDQAKNGLYVRQALLKMLVN